MRICVARSDDYGNSWIANLANGAAPAAAPFLPLGSLPLTNTDHYFRPRLCEGPGGTIACLFSNCHLATPDPTLPQDQQIPGQFGVYLAVSSLVWKYNPDHGPAKNTKPGSTSPGGAQPPHGPIVPSYSVEFYFFDDRSTAVVPVATGFSSLFSPNTVFRWGESQSYFIGDFLGLCASETAFFPYWSDNSQSATFQTWQLFVSQMNFQTPPTIDPT
jgi:hypothetical protein